MHALIPFCTSIPAPTFYQDFVAGIEEGLAEAGHTSLRFPFATIGQLSPEESQRFLEWAKHKRCDWIIDLCGWGFIFSRIKWRGAGVKSERVFDSMGAHYLVCMLDQPFFQPIKEIESNNLLLGYPDRDHPTLVSEIYSDWHCKKTVFLPPATRLVNDLSINNWSDRDETLLYAGNLDLLALEPINARTPMESLIQVSIDQLLENPRLRLSQVIERSRIGLGLSLNATDLIDVYRAIEYHWRHRLRYMVISGLAKAKVKIRVFGAGWDKKLYGETVSIYPAMDYPKFISLMGSSRICLDASTYMNGANDRAAQFGINGAVFLSNADGYLPEAFSTGLHVYNPGDIVSLAEAINDLSSRPSELEEQSRQLRIATERQNLWRHRLQRAFASQ